MTSSGKQLSSRYVVVGATCLVVAVCAVFGAPGCAASDEGDRAAPDLRLVLPSADGGDEASIDGGAEAGSPSAPCAVGNLCRAPVPFTQAWVTAINGRSKNDVWATGSFGLVMHYDGQKWTSLESDLGEALTTLALTEDETWGGSGTLVMRRRFDAASVRSVRIPVPHGVPRTFAVVTDDVVYVATENRQAPVVKLEFDANKVTPVPSPVHPSSDEAQVVTFRACFWNPGKALWFVGDRGAVARYPVAEAGEADAGTDGGTPEPLGRGVIISVPSQADLRAAWVHGDRLFVAGRNGTVLEHDGSGWREHETGTRVTLNALFGLSPTDIWAAGDEGTVLHFDGTTWTRIGAGTYDGSLKSIWGSGPDDVWIGGENRLFHWGPLP